MDPSASSSPIPLNIPIESLPGLLSDARTVDRSGVAATACLAFDILITLDQEVDYIWNSSWTFPKILYLFSRYFTLVVQLVNTSESTSFTVTNNVCQSWTYFEAVSGQMVVMGVEISLMMRVYALYKRDKRILALLLALYFSEVLSNSLILGLGLKKIVSIAPLKGLLPPRLSSLGLFPHRCPWVLFFILVSIAALSLLQIEKAIQILRRIPTLIFESILFILMCINFVRFTVVHKTRVQLLTLFVRDGTVFYAVIFVTLLTQVLLYELVNSALAQVAIAWQLTVLSIASSRLIINLRANAAKPVVETYQLTDMRFGSNLASSRTEPSYNESSEQTTAFERSRTSNSSEKVRSQAARLPKREKVLAPFDVPHASTSSSNAEAVVSFTEGQAPRRNNVGKSDWHSNWEGV